MKLNPVKVFFGILNNHLLAYPTPFNLNYFWNFGSLAGLTLAIQLVTGIFLSMHYVPNIQLAFASVEHIMRDVNYGWLFRYLHANGASFFFIVTYLHIARNLYFRSYYYPRIHLWYSGIIIFFLMMGTAFMGYVLPWGQMSFWGATVITNLFSAFPLFGESLASWLWGGFSVGNPTLNRFFSLHFILSFAILGLVIVHLILLHEVGSSNPLSVYGSDKIPFYPYFYVKDFFGFLVFLTFLLICVFWYPNLLGHPDNYIPANPLVTPAHIVPEWYFLPFYAILRSIPDKLGGVLAMFCSILILFLLPLLDKFQIPQSLRFQFFFKFFFWVFISCVVLLGWLGSMPAAAPYVGISQLLTCLYFFFFISLPFWGRFLE